MPGKEPELLLSGVDFRGAEIDEETIVLADELWWLGERDAAQALLARAELNHPDDFHLQVKLGVRHMNLLHNDKAFPHLKAAHSLKPDNSWVLATLGLMHRKRGERER